MTKKPKRNYNYNINYIHLNLKSIKPANSYASLSDISFLYFYII